MLVVTLLDFLGHAHVGFPKSDGAEVAEELYLALASEMKELAVAMLTPRAMPVTLSLGPMNIL